MALGNTTNQGPEGYMSASRGFHRLLVLIGLAAALLVVARSPVLAQASKTVRIIYPFAAGSGGDTMARIVAEKLAVGLGTAVIVDNRTGAAGRIGTKAVATADPDGTTLLFVPNPPVAIYPHSYSALEYDPVRDLTPVSLVATFDVGLAVAPLANISNIKDLVAWAKQNPAQANYGSPGAGGLGHFFAVMFAASTGLDLKHVSYRGSAAVMTDLIGGQIPMAFIPLGDALELHKSNRAKLLAVSGAERSPLLPDVPTFRESGVLVDGQGWYALYAPARTPAHVVERINRAVITGLGDAETKQRILNLSLVPRTSSPAELAAFQLADSQRWAPAVKASGFTPQQ
jgi:tripartite-type tricarboxylate transporter receptor subunit TctC